MKRAPGLPPQRGGIEGGEKRSRHTPPSKHLHAGHPTLDPSPEGREIAAFMRGAHQASSHTVSKWCSSAGWWV